MKIGVCVRYKDINTLEEQLKNVHEAGFSYIQLVAWDFALMTREHADTVLALTKKYNIEISALWCGWEGTRRWNFTEGPQTLGLLPKKYRRRRIKNLCQGSEFAKMLGVCDVVTHMGFIPENLCDRQFKPMCKAIKKVAEYMKQNGQNLLFESGQETPVAMLRCFEEVGLDNLYVNLDTANLILYGKANPTDALDVIGGYVRNIHAKDGFYPTNGKTLGHEVRLGDGKVNFASFFEKLRELDYHGHVTIEREVGGEKGKADVAYAKKYLEKLIEKIYGENELC